MLKDLAKMTMTELWDELRRVETIRRAVGAKRFVFAGTQNALRVTRRWDALVAREQDILKAITKARIAKFKLASDPQ